MGNHLVHTCTGLPDHKYRLVYLAHFQFTEAQLATSNYEENIAPVIGAFFVPFPFPISISSFCFQFPFHFCFLLFHMPVLGIIVLHKTMTVRVHTLNEWHQALHQNIGIHLSIHDPLKNAYFGAAFPTYSGPNMNFDRVFWSRLVTRLLPVLTTAKTAMGLQLNGGFVTFLTLILEKMASF